MPIYEYRCDKCQAQFEELVLSAGASTAVKCRHCNSSRVTKLMAAFAVHGAAQSRAPEPGGCGSCGAEKRGMCGME